MTAVVPDAIGTPWFAMTIDTWTSLSEPVSVSVIVQVAGGRLPWPMVYVPGPPGPTGGSMSMSSWSSGQVMWNCAGRVHVLVLPVTSLSPRIAGACDLVGERAGDDSVVDGDLHAAAQDLLVAPRKRWR